MKHILRELVVTLNENHWINILFNIVEIFQKCKIFENYWIQKFNNNADLRKQDFLSQEKISYHISSFFIILSPIILDQAWTKNLICILSKISIQKKLSYLVRCIISFNAGSGKVFKWFCCPFTCSFHHWSSLRQQTNKKSIQKKILGCWMVFLCTAFSKPKQTRKNTSIGLNYWHNLW